MLKLIWLIPILPLVGVAINGLFGKRLSRRAGRTDRLRRRGLGALPRSAEPVLELSRLPEDARFFETNLGTWIPDGPIGDAGR
jgi:hypothetical protein